MTSVLYPKSSGSFMWQTYSKCQLSFFRKEQIGHSTINNSFSIQQKKYNTWDHEMHEFEWHYHRCHQRVKGRKRSSLIKKSTSASKWLYYHSTYHKQEHFQQKHNS